MKPPALRHCSRQHWRRAFRHWTFAARSDGSIDWPPGAAELPHGPEIRFAPLAVIAPGALEPLEDCRITAGSLIDRVLHYRGGDGQEVLFPPA